MERPCSKLVLVMVPMIPLVEVASMRDPHDQRAYDVTRTVRRTTTLIPRTTLACLGVTSMRYGNSDLEGILGLKGRVNVEGVNDRSSRYLLTVRKSRLRRSINAVAGHPWSAGEVVIVPLLTILLNLARRLNLGLRAT